MAEGVETEQQLEFLRSHRCDEYQGYYFSLPLPSAEFIAKHRQTKPHSELTRGIDSNKMGLSVWRAR